MASSRLVVNQGPEPGQTFILDKDSLTIGRDPHNDITISDPQVSRQHARIMRQGDLIVLEDVGSTNGTFVNGVRLTGSHTLANNNVVGLGDAITLTYHGSDPATTEPLGGRPTVSIQQPGYEPPPPPAYAAPPPPAYTAPPPPAYAAPPPPAYAAEPPPAYAAEPPVEEKKSRTGLLIGCGCLLLLVIVACIGVVVLDYLSLLPPIFYEPLRWLGLL